MNIYTILLKQYITDGIIERQVEIVARSEEEAWKELHSGIYRYKDAILIKKQSMN